MDRKPKLHHESDSPMFLNTELKTNKEYLRLLFVDSPDAVFVQDTDGNVLDVNPAACQLHEMTYEELVGMNVLDLVPPDYKQQVQEQYPGWKDGVLCSYQGFSITKTGKTVPVEIRGRRLDHNGQTINLLHVRDITQRTQEDNLLQGQKRVLELIAEGAPLIDILNGICTVMDQQFQGGMCSALLMNDDGKTLRTGAGPGLPKAYAKALDGMQISDCAGSCGTAAYTRQQVIVSDISTDPLWAPFKDLALLHNIQACWSTPLFNSDGTVLGTFAVSHHHPGTPSPRDFELIATASHIISIAIRHCKAEESLKKSVALHMATIESSAEGILVVDLDGTWVSVNTKFTELWQVPQEIIDSGSDEKAQAFFNSQVQDSETFAAKVAAICDHPENEVSDVVHMKDGRILELYYMPHRLGEHIVGRIWSFRDITARKQREEHNLIQTAALEATAHAVMITDRNGIIIWINPAFTECTGYSLDEAVGQSTRLLRSGDEDDAFYKNMWETIFRGDVWKGTIINRKKDGSLYPEEQTITPVSNANGAITHFISVKQDITERKKAEEEKERIQSHLLQSQKIEAVGRLAGGIAHDFNNLLTSILGFSELAMESISEDHPARNDIEEIIRAGDSASQLTHQLLAFSRNEVLEQEVLNVTDVVAGMEKMLQRTLGEDITLGSTLSLSVGSIKANRGQLEQVIMNLAVNARDAMPKGGRLNLQTYQTTLSKEKAREQPDIFPGIFSVLSVRDFGSGIPTDITEHIFEPFFTTKGLKGTGLGLSTVYGIVTLYGGFITVDSELGKGTEFKVYFPTVSQEANRSSEHLSTVSGGTETILVVEDQASVRRLASRFLRSLGYEIIEARDPGLAQDIFAMSQQPIDLVLTDVIMPGMAGPDLVDALIKQKNSFKVLYMTGFSEEKLSAHGIESDDSVILQKPFSRDALARKVRDVLDAD